MTSCLLCSRWDVKATPYAMRKHGLARCESDKPWEYRPAHFSCPKFQELSAELVAARVEWAQKKSLV